MADPFAGVLLKLDRADHHLRVLNRIITRFLDRKPYGIVAKVESTDREPLPHTVYRVAVREHPSAAIGYLIGDATHNLRCALDHIAWMLPRSPRPPDERVPQFPICTKAEYWDPDASSLGGLSPEAVEAIKGLQPFPRADGGSGGGGLATILKLSNFDKHREIVVGGMAPRSLGWFSGGEGSRADDIIYAFFGPFVGDAITLEFAPDAEVSMQPVLMPNVTVAKPEELSDTVLPDGLQKAAAFVRETVVPTMRDHVPGRHDDP